MRISTVQSSTVVSGVRGAAASEQGRRGWLLACGVLAGPFYLAVGLAQAFTRPGFDLTRHDLSVLANGDLGWIQSANLIITGLLVVLAAQGLRSAMPSGRGRTWGPLLVGLYGLGMIGAGFFSADPALGFPPGTAADASAVSWHGLLHFACGGIGFLGLIVGCFVFARRFAEQHRRGWSAFSSVTGVVFLAAFVGIASGGSGNRLTVLGFWLGLIVAWVWLAALSRHLLQQDPPNAVETVGEGSPASVQP